MTGISSNLNLLCHVCGLELNRNEWQTLHEKWIRIILISGNNALLLLFKKFAIIQSFDPLLNVLNFKSDLHIPNRKNSWLWVVSSTQNPYTPNYNIHSIHLFSDSGNTPLSNCLSHLKNEWVSVDGTIC